MFKFWRLGVKENQIKKNNLIGPLTSDAIKKALAKYDVKIPVFGMVKNDKHRTKELINENKEKIEISFSSKYMLEALKTIKEEDILILLNSDIKPIIIKSVKDESLIQLILPIKTY